MIISMSSLMLLVVAAYAVGGLSGALVVAAATDRFSLILIGNVGFCVGIGFRQWLYVAKPKHHAESDDPNVIKLVAFGKSRKLHGVGDAGCDYTAKCGEPETHTMKRSLLRSLKGKEILCKTCCQGLA